MFLTNPLYHRKRKNPTPNVFFAVVIIPTSICLNLRRIKFIEGVLKVTLQKRTLRQLFICLRLPPLLGSCLGVGKKFVGSEHRVHTEWQWPISGVHSIMMGKSVLAGEGGGCTPTPFHSIYVPSHTMVQSTLQLRGQKHSSYFTISSLPSTLQYIKSVFLKLQSVKAQQNMVSNTT